MSHSNQAASSLRRRFQKQVELPECLIDYGFERKLEKKLYDCIFVKTLSATQAFVFFATVCVLAVISLAFPASIGLWLTTLSSSAITHVLASIGIGLGLYRLWSIISCPTHLGVTADGVRLHWNRVFGRLPAKTIRWSQMSSIQLIQPRGTMLVEQQCLSFTGSTGKVQLKLKGLNKPDQRKVLFDLICQYAPAPIRDFDISVLLGASEATTYTEIWLKALSAPPERERTAPLSAGAVLKEGTYQIVDRLGMGGQGTAYVASMLVDVPGARKGETVVLKEYILPIQVSLSAKKQSLERLEFEAKLLKKLNHPNVVRLIDFFVEDHRGYLVLEHIRGSNLRQGVAANGVMPYTMAGKLALQMCDILEYLHGQTPSVVHRDFTPDNLLLTEEGNLKLIDFNVAHQRTATMTASVVGKHSYIPPEQFRGRPIPQSDIYAMGATLHFLLTGEDPRPLTVSHPGAIAADVPFALDDMIAWSTAMDPDSRISIAELRMTLKTIAAAPHEVFDASPNGNFGASCLLNAFVNSAYGYSSAEPVHL